MDQHTFQKIAFSGLKSVPGDTASAQALMRALGTRLECRHRVFVRTEKKSCGKLF